MSSASSAPLPGRQPAGTDFPNFSLYQPTKAVLRAPYPCNTHDSEGFSLRESGTRGRLTSEFALQAGRSARRSEGVQSTFTSRTVDDLLTPRAVVTVRSNAPTRRNVH
jgi:hypothetical protein